MENTMTEALHRREFLKLGGALTAAALVPLSRRRGAGEEAHHPQSDHVRHSHLQRIGLGAIPAVKAAGFEGVEPMSHMNQDEVVKAFEETGLKPASVCCNTHWGKPLSSPDDRRAPGRP